MTWLRSIRLGAFAALALLTAALSIASLAALNSGGAFAGLRVAMGYDRAAEALLAEPTPPPAAQGRAARLSHDAITRFPYDSAAWLRLAYVDWLANGRLTPQGAAWLKRSYDLVAVDPDVGLWRIHFALENSQSLSADLRADVRNEAFALLTNGSMRTELRQLMPTIHNPAGRLSLALWLSRPTTVAK